MSEGGLVEATALESMDIHLRINSTMSFLLQMKKARGMTQLVWGYTRRTASQWKNRLRSPGYLTLKTRIHSARLGFGFSALHPST